MTQNSEQRNPAEQFFSESPRNSVMDYLAYEFEDIERDIIFDFAVAYAKSVTLKLAEEAEQEADVHANSVGPQSGYQERMAKCRNAKIAAAWLREKAR